MLKQLRNIDKLLILVSVIAAILGIFTNSVMISIMFIITIWSITKYLKCEEIYDLVYTLLIISAFYDYSLHLPKVSSVYTFHIILGIMSIYSLIKIVRDRDILKKIDRKIVVIYILWFAYMLLSILWSANKTLSIKYIAIYLMMFAFIGNIMIYNISKEKLKYTLKIVLIMVGFITIIGLIEILLGKQLPVKHYADDFLSSLPQIDQNYINARPIAFSFNPNNLSATLAILMPFFYCLIYKSDSRLKKIIYMAITIISFVVISTTSSRTGFISAAIGVGIFVIYSIINIKKIGIKKLIYPIILIISLGLAYQFSYLIMNVKPVDGKDITSNALSDKVKTLENQEITVGGDGSLNVRVTIIKDVIGDIIVNKNYKGYGVGNIEEFIKQKGNTTGIYSPHCYAIEILGDFGVFGVLLYGVYYLYLLINNLILTIKKKSATCFASATSLLIFAPASFGPSSITYVFSYWIVIGLSISTIQVYKTR